MGWRGRPEGELGWGTHVNPWLIHVNVWQKPLKFKKKKILTQEKKKEYLTKFVGCSSRESLLALQCFFFFFIFKREINV